MTNANGNSGDTASQEDSPTKACALIGCILDRTRDSDGHYHCPPGCGCSATARTLAAQQSNVHIGA